MIYQKFDRIPVSFNEQLIQEIGLYSKGYFGINAKCHKEIKDKKVVSEIFLAFENLKELDAVGQNVSVISGLSALNFVFTIFFFVASLDLSSYKLEEINKGNNITVKFFLLFLFFAISNLIAVFILSIVNTTRLYAVGSLDVIFADQLCVDSFSFDIYNKNFSVVGNGKRLMLVSLCFSFAFFVLYVFYLMSFVKSHIMMKRVHAENLDIEEADNIEEEKKKADLTHMEHRTYITLNQ